MSDANKQDVTKVRQENGVQAKEICKGLDAELEAMLENAYKQRKSLENHPRKIAYSKYLAELSEKNMLYSFIISSGLMSEYADYYANMKRKDVDPFDAVALSIYLNYKSARQNNKQ